MFTTLKSSRLRSNLALLVCLGLPPPAARAAESAPPAAPAEIDGNFSGKVVATMDADRYTYVEVDTGSHRLWAATTHLAVRKGDAVTVRGGMPMLNFHSKVLKRDFDLVFFTGSIVVHSADETGGKTAPVLPPGHPALTGADRPGLPPGHPALTGQPGPGVNVDGSGIKKAAGGRTVQEIIARGTQLAGRPVKVRGRVVKYNAMVMGRNWLHIRDGSGSADKADNDLTVTTTTPAKVGDIVLVAGRVSTNRDFGAGYKYAVILEDAAVTVE